MQGNLVKIFMISITVGVSTVAQAEERHKHIRKDKYFVKKGTK